MGRLHIMNDENIRELMNMNIKEEELMRLNINSSENEYNIRALGTEDTESIPFE